MAVHSSMVPLGTFLPDQTLSDVTGRPFNLHQVRGSGVLVVMWSANHCPYVQHLEQALAALAGEFADRPVSFVAICSNDVVAYPDDDLAGLSAQAARAGWTFPYLVDPDQTVAHDFGAVCTPDFFVYGFEGQLLYRGAFDESTPRNDVPVTGDLLRSAISLVVAGRPVPEPQRPAMGCAIKWR